MLRLNQTFYEHGGKPCKLLAWQIKQLETRKNITSIINNNDDTRIDPTEINREFRKYYENLYQSQVKYDPQTQITFIDRLNIPSISKEFAEMLEADLNEEEIRIAIDGMKAGPDGIGIN